MNWSFNRFTNYSMGFKLDEWKNKIKHIDEVEIKVQKNSSEQLFTV